MVVGANDPFASRRRNRGTKHKIKSFEVHDKYDIDTRTANYDVAIVEVEKEIKFKRNVWPICIPEKVDEDQNKYNKQTVSALGYGVYNGRTGWSFFNFLL